MISRQSGGSSWCASCGGDGFRIGEHAGVEVQPSVCYSYQLAWQLQGPRTLSIVRVDEAIRPGSHNTLLTCAVQASSRVRAGRQIIVAVQRVKLARRDVALRKTRARLALTTRGTHSICAVHLCLYGFSQSTHVHVGDAALKT